MDTVTVSGMVLSAMPVGEYDRRIVLLTVQRGRLSAFVRGARKQNSTLLAASRPFAMGEFTLFEGRDSYTVQSAAIKEYFEILSHDVVGMAYGCYFMEVAGFYSEENADGKELLNLLYFSLKALEKPAIPNELVRLIFEYRVLAAEGEYPQVFECGKCKKSLTEGWLSIERGGCVCRECRAAAGETYHVFLDAASMYTLQFILTAPLGRLYTFQLSSEVQETLKNVLERWHRRYQNREFKSLAVLKQMEEFLGGSKGL